VFESEDRGRNVEQSVSRFEGRSSPPAHTEHLARCPFVEFPSFCIFKPDAFMSRDVEGEMMILEVFVVAAFRHVHVDGALGQTSANVKVHSHVCCPNLVGLGFRTTRACQ
jgi:hypothetical protein